MAHRNARLTPYARRLLVERYLGGWPAARVAEQLGVSRATVYKWVRRYRAEGWAGLVERSSRSHRCPTRTSAEVETRILELRRRRHRGPVLLAGELGLVASTVGRVLARHRVAPLTGIDPITGAPLRRSRGGRRYQRSRPGELLHVDVRKLGRIPDGGGWRLHGRGATATHHTQTTVGDAYLHVAVDDHSRAAYIEALPDEREATCAQFLHGPRPGFTSAGSVSSGS
jgi:transposase